MSFVTHIKVAAHPFFDGGVCAEEGAIKRHPCGFPFLQPGQEIKEDPVWAGGTRKNNLVRKSKTYFENGVPCLEIWTMRGQLIIASWEDRGLLTRYCWAVNKEGYATTTIGKSTYAMHGVLLEKKHGLMVDHRDRNKLNNRRENLRHATASENSVNVRAGKRPYIGTRPTKSGKWIARIGKDRKYHDTGVYPTEEAAARAYDELAKKHHGEFARLNFPNL